MITVDIYTTIAGDTWDLVSFRVYGDEHYADVLMAANPAYAGILIFDAGVELVCPDITQPVVTNLPPWKSATILAA